MTAGEITAPVESVEQQPVEQHSRLRRYYDLHPAYRLIGRWTLIMALAGFAFHRSIASLIDTTRQGSIGGYVWTVPMVAILVAITISRRARTELPIHDRQTDIIVGIMGLVLALLIQGVLLPRYDLYFNLLRLDLVAMWLFVASSAVVLFGLRPLMRFVWVWILLLGVFSLPYFLIVITLGGGKAASGAGMVALAALALGIGAGPSYRRGFLGSAAAWVLGFAVLAAIALLYPEAHLLVYQQVPALTAIVVLGVVFFLHVRRGRSKTLQIIDRKVEPLAAKQVWSGVPLTVGAALVLSMFPLPVSPNAGISGRPSDYPLVTGMPLVAPPGWTTSGAITRIDVNRLFGSNAVLVRQRITADVANPRWDKLGRTRTVVVDSTVSQRPVSFVTIPARVLYGLTAARISETRIVDLGMGVVGDLISVIDDDLLVTWNALQFVWGQGHLAQRVTIFAVDNHETGAPFPQPTQNLFPVVQTLMTLLFRGNAVLNQRTPSFKDADLLSEFGRALVAAQLGPAP